MDVSGEKKKLHGFHYIMPSICYLLRCITKEVASGEWILNGETGTRDRETGLGTPAIVVPTWHILWEVTSKIVYTKIVQSFLRHRTYFPSIEPVLVPAWHNIWEVTPNIVYAKIMQSFFTAQDIFSFNRTGSAIHFLFTDKNTSRSPHNVLWKNTRHKIISFPDLIVFFTQSTNVLQ